MSAVGSVRVARAGDAAAIADIYRPYVTDAAVSFELEPPTVTEMAERITTLLERTPWLVAVHDEEVIGYAYAARHRDRAAYQWSVEVSAYTRADARRGGVARALYTRLFEALALQGYYNAYGGITLPNPASVGFHEALGFKLVGVYHSIGFKHGSWHDVAWYERALRPHDTAEDPPLPFSAIRDQLP